MICTRMSSIPYGLIIILLTWSKIVAANDQNDPVSPKSLLEKDTILKSSVEQDENSNKLTKRSIQSPLFNQLSYDYYYNQRFPQPAAAMQFSSYSSFPAWQPQVYQMNPFYPNYRPVYQNNRPFYQDNRPYYAPAWNNFEGLPVNIQPQPIYYNFGYPIDNPPNGFLPPVEGCQPQPCSNTGVELPNRFGGDDGPVWDTVPVIKPTRPTRRPGQGHVTPPPLIHNAHDTDEEIPAPSTPFSATQPSRCVWAIVSCCSDTSNKISYSCFEQLGCSGAFWDSNPCETEFARAAIANVMKYYQSN